MIFRKGFKDLSNELHQLAQQVVKNTIGSHHKSQKLIESHNTYIMSVTKQGNIESHVRRILEKQEKDK